MMLAVRRFVTRFFGSDEIEQNITVLAPQATPEWEHYFPRHDRDTAQGEQTEREQAEQASRIPALRAR